MTCCLLCPPCFSLPAGWEYTLSSSLDCLTSGIQRHNPHRGHITMPLVQLFQLQLMSLAHLVYSPCPTESLWSKIILSNTGVLTQKSIGLVVESPCHRYSHLHSSVSAEQHFYTAIFNCSAFILKVAVWLNFHILGQKPTSTKIGALFLQQKNTSCCLETKSLIQPGRKTSCSISWNTAGRFFFRCGGSSLAPAGKESATFDAKKAIQFNFLLTKTQPELQNSTFTV